MLEKLKENKPRIIYNCDACEPYLHFPSPDKIKEEYFLTPLSILEGSQVDIFCWGVGGGDMIVRYPSKVTEVWGDRVPVEKRDIYRRALDSFVKQGKNPVEMMGRKAREMGIAFYTSVRMNDTHHKTHQNPQFASDFWTKHPQFRNWGVTDGACYFNGTLNYSHEEVRERRLNVIRELATDYDVDGIELDFGRTPYLFSPNEAWEKREIATDFMRQVRREIKEIGRKKNKELGIIVRTPIGTEKLKKCGMDIQTWMEEKLADIFVVSPLHRGNDFNQSLSPWNQIAQSSDVLLYGGIEFDIAHNAPLHTFFIDSTPEEYLGRAQQYFEQGADGVYLFNVACLIRRMMRSHKYYEYIDVIKKAGSPDTLGGQDKTFTFYTDLPLELEVQRPPEYYQTVNFTVHDKDLENNKGHWELNFDVTGFPEKKYLHVILNGREIPLENVKYSPCHDELIPGGDKVSRGRSGYIKGAYYEKAFLKLDPAQINNGGSNSLAFFLEEGPRVEHTHMKIYDLQVKAIYIDLYIN